MTLRIAYCWPGPKPDPWVQGLCAAVPGAEVSVWQPGDAPADYAVVWAPPQAFIDGQPRLKALFNTGAGVDALLQLQLPPGLRVVRLDDAGMSAQMVEYVCQAVIRHVRELDGIEADMRAGHWGFRKPRLRSDYPVAVLGLGVLGSRVALALRALGWAVNGWSRSPRTLGEGVQCWAGQAGLQPCLAASRVLVNLLPLTPDTRDLLDHTTLGWLQPGAYVINVARGAHLVDADLLALLDSGHLAGATLDVFRTEPLPPAHPFWRHPRITLTPHTSARTLRDESIAQIARKIGQLERGEAIAGVVDRGAGY